MAYVHEFVEITETIVLTTLHIGYAATHRLRLQKQMHVLGPMATMKIEQTGHIRICTATCPTIDFVAKHCSIAVMILPDADVKHAIVAVALLECLQGAVLNKTITQAHNNHKIVGREHLATS